MKEKSRLFSAATLVVIMLVFAVISLISNGGRRLCTDIGAESWGDGWYYDRQDAAISIVADEALSGADRAVLTKTLPAGLSDGDCLYIDVGSGAVEVRVDGSRADVQQLQSTASVNRKSAANWAVAPLTADFSGKTVELQISAGAGEDHPRVIAVYLGARSGITLTLLGEDLNIFIVAIVFLMLALAAAIAPLFISELPKSENFYATTLIAVGTIWILSNSAVLKLLFAGGEGIQLTQCLSHMLMPVLVMLYFMQVYSNAKKLMSVTTLISAGIFCLGCVLAVIKLLPLTDGEWLARLNIVMCLVCCVAASIKEMALNKSIMPRLLLGGLCAAGASAMLRMALVALDLSAGRIELSVFGLLCLFVVLTVNVVGGNGREYSRAKDFAAMTNNIPCGIVRTRRDPEVTIVYANESFYSMFGYTEKTAREDGFVNMLSRIHPDDVYKIQDELNKAENEGRTQFGIQLRQRRKDGVYRWIETRCRLEEDDENVIVSIEDITEKKAALDDLHVSEEEYRIAASQSDKSILRYDIKSRTIYSAGESKLLLAALPGVVRDVPNSTVESQRVARESINEYLAFFEAMSKGVPKGSCVCKMAVVGGDFKWVKADYTLVCDAEGKPAHAIISYFDVSEQREKEIAFEKWKQSYDSIPKEEFAYLVCNLSEGVVENHDGGLVDDCTELDFSMGTHELAELYAEGHVVPADYRRFNDFTALDRLLIRYDQGLREDKMEFRRICGENDIKWTEFSVQLLPDPYSYDIKCFAIFKDIDERKRKELELALLSTTDPLTGLLNRRCFEERANAVFSGSGLAALVLIDIDEFKALNDKHGHYFGDQVLMELSKRMRAQVRIDDLVCRLGGDEFLVCLNDLSMDDSALEKRIERLMESFISEEVMDTKITASIGAAVSPKDGTRFDELYLKADAAMYRSKRKGKNCYAIYDPDLDSREKRS